METALCMGYNLPKETVRLTVLLEVTWCNIIRRAKHFIRLGCGLWQYHCFLSHFFNVILFALGCNYFLEMKGATSIKRFRQTQLNISFASHLEDSFRYQNNLTEPFWSQSMYCYLILKQTFLRKSIKSFHFALDNMSFQDLDLSMSDQDCTS